jgi:DNA-binding NarL/FixJ family response regulator
VTPTRLAIADDHALFRQGLKALLRNHDDVVVVGEASNGVEAIERFGALRPDVTLMDLQMPELDGIDALQAIRERHPGARVIVLTTYAGDVQALKALKNGAAGYLLKSEPPVRIVQFLRGVAQGEAALSGSVARRLLEQVRSGSGRGTGVPDEIAAALSARELEVLLLLDDHLGTDEIAKRLFISEHTVRSHVKSLLRKLNVSSRREALEALSVARG